MSSSNQNTGWIPLLLKTARNIRRQIQETLYKRHNLGVLELKKLLDLEAQNSLENTLRNAGLSIQVISEEGEATIGEGGMYLIADPVDGTTNLARGIPIAVVSLAVSENKKLSGTVAGLVMDLFNGSVFKAERNRGAWKGRKKIRPSMSRSIKDALISIDISKGTSLKPVEKIINNASHLRQLGCSALALCYTASGIIDAHIDLRGTLRATDATAGLLILKESGGIYKLNNKIDGDLKLTRHSKFRVVAASCKKMLEEISDLIE